MTHRRVVVTGLGIVSPHGSDPAIMFDALLAGRSAVRMLSVPSRVGTVEIAGAPIQGEIHGTVPAAQRVASDRVSLLALVAAEAARVDAGLDLAASDPSRIGVAVGTSQGGIISQELAYTDMLIDHKARLSPFTLVKVMHNGPAAQIGLRYGLHGPSLTYTTTCSSSTVAIGEALRHIRHGYADMMFAGGAEAPFSYVSMKAWQALQVLAPVLAADPGATCRPFSRDRNGTVLGEGAAFLVVEERERALARNARIYAEIAGYAVTNDGTHMTQPSVAEQVRPMRLALEDACLGAESVDYINAHGTGTVLNDIAETQAIHEVLGGLARDVAVSSTKSMHGHLVGAAGALEAIVCALSLWRGAIPPTAHLRDTDPRCDLDYVPREGRQQSIAVAMSNSFAVGGTAGVLVLRKH